MPRSVPVQNRKALILHALNDFSMEYSRIVAVTGLPGLYEILSSKSDGAIVRSLDDESTKFVSSRVHNLSHLESIEIYTTGENVSLGDVFTAMKGSTEASPDVKDNTALKGYFEKIFPQLDTDRVYASDMKKMVNWFAVLEKHNVDYTPKEEEEVEAEGAVEEDLSAVASAKAEAPKPEALAGEEAIAETPAEAPAKKARAKKAAATAASVEEKVSAEKKAPAKASKKNAGE